jgi:hypothetical protein
VVPLEVGRVTSLLDFVAWGGWLFAAGLIACAVGTVLRFDVDRPPLLCRYADAKDQQRMVALIAVQERRALADDCAPDLFAHALEEIRSLPQREHP